MEIKEILEKIALPARSNKKGFKVADKLEAINSLLIEKNSPYRLIHKSPHVWLFGQKELEPDKRTLLISSHADVVDSIRNPYSSYDSDEKYFFGTYDNLGTNAAGVYLMLNEKLPSNVYFAFTADEETGRCNGAWHALHYVAQSTKRSPFVFALDVTDEGYDNDRLLTIEGLHARNEEFRVKMLEMFMETEGEEQSFEVVRLKKKDNNSFLPESYQSKEITVFDESVFYARANCNSCSICLPGEGDMHSDRGFYIKEAVMKGYCAGLAAAVLAFTTRSNPRLEELKKEKDLFTKEARDTAFHKEISYTYPRYEFRDYSEQIPGQMSLADFDDQFKESLRDAMADPYLMDEILDEIVEMVQCYAEDQFDIFYSDVLYTYGLKRKDSLEEFLKDVFKEVQFELQHGYEEER